MCENVHFDGNTLPSQLKEMFSFQFRYLNERQADQGKWFTKTLSDFIFLTKFEMVKLTGKIWIY